MRPTDEQLLQKFIDTQDASAFAKLHRRYVRRLTAKAFRRVGTYADDVVQDVFIKVARYADKWNPEQDETREVKWWINQWLDKCIVDQIRRNYKDRLRTNCGHSEVICGKVRRTKTASMNARTCELEPVDHRADAPDERAIQQEFTVAFQACFDGLKPKDARAVRLILIDGHTHRGAAAISGEHATQLARCLNRANASMRIALASHA